VGRVQLDLNADLGEGFGHWSLGDDDALLDVVTSANVACGFHAGDPTIMRRVCQTAAARGVAIGAQVGYRDLAGFGRRPIAMDPDDLTADVLYQLGALRAFAAAAGTRVRYLKPHGALYNTVFHDCDQAGAVVAALSAYEEPIALLALPGSVIADQARAAGIAVVHEGFADRAYLADGTLVARSRPGAVLTDPAEIASRAVQMAVEHRVRAADGTELSLSVGSICVHGDTPDAVLIARTVAEALDRAGVTPHPFA
jgi:UPF0271 protein